MKKIILIAMLFLSKLTFGQIPIEVSSPVDFSKNDKLSIDAFSVLKTNKYLDFKGRDTLVAIINDTIYEKIDLNNYFGYKKNWNEVEKENYLMYKQEGEKYQYTFLDSTMTETYDKYGSYGVRREITTVYNSKGFILNRQEKVFVGDNYNETRIKINEFDKKNRVTKITNRTERKNPKENQEEIIEATYDENLIKVTSSNGVIYCKFLIDSNSIGFISKLSPRETASNFMYALGQKRFDLAKEYCTNKMVEELKVLESINNQIEEVWLKSGSGKFSEDKVTVNDIWEIKFSTSKKEKYNVDFVILKQKNGWKIDEFKIRK